MSSSQSSPRPDILPNQPDITSAFDISFDALALNSYSPSDFSAEPYIGPTVVCSPIDITTDDFWCGGGELFPAIGDSLFSEDHAFHHAHGSDEQATDFDALLYSENVVDMSPRKSAYQSLDMETQFSQFTDPPTQLLSSADLDLYRTFSRSILRRSVIDNVISSQSILFHILQTRSHRACSDVDDGRQTATSRACNAGMRCPVRADDDFD